MSLGISGLLDSTEIDVMSCKSGIMRSNQWIDGGAVAPTDPV